MLASLRRKVRSALGREQRPTTLTVLLTGEPDAAVYWCIQLCPRQRILRLFRVAIRPSPSGPSPSTRERRFHDLVPTGVIRTHSWPPHEPPPAPPPSPPKPSHPFEATAPVHDPHHARPPDPPAPPLPPIRQGVALATDWPTLRIEDLIPLGELRLSPTETLTSLAASLAKACIDDVRGVVAKGRQPTPSKLAGMDGTGEVLARVYLTAETERKSILKRRAGEQPRAKLGAVYLARVVMDKPSGDTPLDPV